MEEKIVGNRTAPADEVPDGAKIVGVEFFIALGNDVTLSYGRDVDDVTSRFGWFVNVPLDCRDYRAGREDPPDGFHGSEIDAASAGLLYQAFKDRRLFKEVCYNDPSAE